MSLPVVSIDRPALPPPKVVLLYPERDPEEFIATILTGTLMYLPNPGGSVLVVISNRNRDPVQMVCIGNLQALEEVTDQTGKVFYRVVTNFTRELEELGKLRTAAVTFPLLSI